MTLALPIALPRFGKAHKPLQRRSRRPFRPIQGNGRYKLPKAVLAVLAASLADFRNADAAMALAVFLARFWSSPAKLGLPFPIDRRALAEHSELSLTEGQIRGAILTLERVGFLDRNPLERGSRHRRVGDELHRKAVQFRFGVETVEAFRRANETAKRIGTKAVLRPVILVQAQSRPKREPSGSALLMGNITRLPQRRAFEGPVQEFPQLERAISGLLSVMREA